MDTMTPKGRSYSIWLAGQELDQPIPRHPPKLRYMIAATPRTGSNLLCDYLRQLGLGLPAEYLELGTAEVLMKRWGCWPTEYIDRLMKLRTVGDAFGIKVMKPDVMIQQIMPLRFIRMIRENAGDQVDSLARAMTTNYFTDIGDPEDRPSAEPVEPSQAVLNMASAIVVSQNKIWDDQFRRVDNMTVSYEVLVAKPHEVMEKVLEYLTEGERTYIAELPTPIVRKLPG